MKKNINTANKTLELEGLENLILRICNEIHMPIRKNQLIRFIKNVFGYRNTIKQIQFALIGLIEQKKLIQHTYFICMPELAAEGITTPTATEEWIFRFLMSEALKEEIRYDVFFDVNSKENITPSIYFKYISMKYPSLISKDKALAFMEQIKGLFPETPYLLKNNFYTEMNDYPYADGLISRIFSDRDSRIIVKNIRATKRYVIIKYLLVPSRKGNYSKAHHNSTELYDGFKFYLDDTIFAAFKDTPVVMVIGSQKKAKKNNRH